eukprot:CAMPEP_0117429618 /NCGR_PEP_ID=MMETSP0758-20121206/9153_1 /TAXON_ID=63605 /ORGANISM="Percolomonas cosmopolitus, Strain AE-1 (ATCC 50343)" /LENGTH=100 /DNA_ID=CAMNT_0005216809 /DNA_START=152 /DNA_END=451 /DNA_ORIENTATION=+
MKCSSCTRQVAVDVEPKTFKPYNAEEEEPMSIEFNAKGVSLEEITFTGQGFKITTEGGTEMEIEEPEMEEGELEGYDMDMEEPYSIQGYKGVFNLESGST